MSCFICRDNPQILYKLCVCNDSTICIDCYELDIFNTMINCAICRKQYKKINNYDITSLLRYTSKLFSIIILVGTVELFSPIYLYTLDKYKYKDVFLAISLFCIFFINTINYFSIKKLDDEKIMNFYIFTHYSIIIIINSIIFITYETPKIEIYSFFILGLVYLLPFLAINIVYWILLITKCKNKLINHFIINRRIKINKVIYLA